jgi:hypothetical protein
MSQAYAQTNTAFLIIQSVGYLMTLSQLHMSQVRIISWEDAYDRWIICQKVWKVIQTGFVHLVQTRGTALSKVWHRPYSQHGHKPLEHGITVSNLAGCMDDFSALDCPLHLLIPLPRSPNVCISKCLEQLCNTGSIHSSLNTPADYYIEVVRRSVCPDHMETYDNEISRS